MVCHPDTRGVCRLQRESSMRFRAVCAAASTVATCRCSSTALSSRVQTAVGWSDAAAPRSPPLKAAAAASFSGRQHSQSMPVHACYSGRLAALCLEPQHSHRRHVSTAAARTEVQTQLQQLTGHEHSEAADDTSASRGPGMLEVAAQEGEATNSDPPSTSGSGSKGRKAKRKTAARKTSTAEPAPVAATEAGTEGASVSTSGGADKGCENAASAESAGVAVADAESGVKGAALAAHPGAAEADGPVGGQATDLSVLRGSVELRSYQQAAVEAVLSNFEMGLVRQLVGMPTGAGKTITFATLACTLNCRTLVLVHRTQLVEQTVAAFKRVWPQARVGCLRGATKRNREEAKEAQVLVVTVQTASQVERLHSLREGEDFWLCIVDEAHHAPASTYQTVMNHLGFLSDDPKKLLLGVTATPYRKDKLLLTNTFQTQAYDITIGELIESGALCRIKAQRILTYTDLTEAQLKAPGKAAADESIEDDIQDFNPEKLTLLINTPERNALVVSSFKRLASERKAIAFACSIAHADDMAAEFNRQGVRAAALHTGLKKNEREAVLEAHKRADIQVLTNVGILTEGYDDTSISCVLMTRPTRSPSLYTQCVGRGFRTSPGKEDCLVLDFTDTHHSLDRLSDLMDIKCIIEGQGVELRDYKKPPPGVIKELKGLVSGGELQLLEKTKYAWVRYGAALHLGVWVDRNQNAYLQLRPLSQQEAAAVDSKSESTDGKSEAAAAGGLADGPLPDQKGKASGDVWQVSYLVEPSGPVESWTPDMWRPLMRLQAVRGGKTKPWLRAVQTAESRLQALSHGLEPGVQAPAELRLFLEKLHLSGSKLKWRSQPATDHQRQRILTYGIDEDDMRQLCKESTSLQSPSSPSSLYGRSGADWWHRLTKGQASDMITLLLLDSKMRGHEEAEEWMKAKASAAQITCLNKLATEAVAKLAAPSADSTARKLSESEMQDVQSKALRVLSNPAALTKQEASALINFFRSLTPRTPRKFVAYTSSYSSFNRNRF